MGTATKRDFLVGMRFDLPALRADFERVLTEGTAFGKRLAAEWKDLKIGLSVDPALIRDAMKVASRDSTQVKLPKPDTSSARQAQEEQTAAARRAAVEREQIRKRELAAEKTAMAEELRARRAAEKEQLEADRRVAKEREAQRKRDLAQRKAAIEEELRARDAAAKREQEEAFKGTPQGRAITFKGQIAEAKELVEMLRLVRAAMIESGQKGTAEYRKVEQQLRDAEEEAERLEKAMQKAGQPPRNSLFTRAFKFDALQGVANAVVQGFETALSKGTEFQAGIAELQAITGVSGSALDDLGKKARSLALEFGGSASGNIEAFKGILSKLGPGIASTPPALEKMTRAVNVLSAATGDDAAASMDALTTGLLQFQVPLDDANAAAEEMTRQMNVMAAGAQFGAAEVPQVAAAIKVAGVAASGAKVSFEETNAAIQALAAGGKIGAEAGTALRNVLGKLGEGRFLPKEVQEELAKAGVDIKVLSDTTIPLTSRLRELKKVYGDAALITKLFGTENSAAASILIRSADSIDTLRAQMTGTNTAFDQAAIRQGTVQAALGRTKAFLEDLAITGFEFVGDKVALAIGMLGQVAPILTTIAGFKTLLPPGFIGNAIDGIKSFLPQLLSLIPGYAGVGTAATVAGTASTAAGTAASSAWLAALGPVLLVVAAIGVLVGGFILLYKNVESFRKVVDTVIGGTLRFITGLVTAILPVLSQIISTVVDLGSLILDVLLAPFDLLFSVVGSIFDVLSSLVEPILGAGQGGSFLKDILFKVREAIISIQGGVAGMKAAFDSVKTSVKGSFDALLQGDVFGAIEGFFEIGDKAGQAFSDAASAKVRSEMRQLVADKGFASLDEAISLKEDLDKGGRIAELRKKLREAKTDAERQSIAQAIAHEVPEAVSGTAQLVDSQGKVTEVLRLNAEVLDRVIDRTKKANEEGSSERKTDVINGLRAQAEMVDELTRKLELQQQTLANKKAIPGADTSELEKDIADAQKKLAEEQAKLQDGLKGAKATGIFDNLDPEARKAFEQLKATQGEKLAEMDRQIREAKLGEVLGKAATISSKLDENDAIGVLVDKWNAAKSQVERDNLAQAIADQVPSAISGYDEVTGAVQISEQRVREFTTTQRGAFSKDLQGQVGEYTTLLREQANDVVALKDRQAELRRKIVEGANAKQDVSKLTEEYKNLTVKVNDASVKLGSTVAQGKKFGLVKGDVSQVTNEFKLTGRQAQVTAEAVKKIGEQTSDAKAEARDLVAEFSKLKSGVEQAVSDNVARLAFFRLEEARRALTDEEKKQREAASNALRQAVKDKRQLDATIEQVEKQFGVREEKSRKEKAGKVAKDRSSELELFRLGQEAKLGMIDNELLREVTAQQQRIELKRKEVEVERQNLRDQLAEAQKAADSGRVVEINAKLKDLDLSNAESLGSKQLKAVSDQVEAELKKLRQSLAGELLKIEDEAFARESELRRAHAEALATDDVVSLRRRNAELLEVQRRDGRLRTAAMLAESREFQAAAKNLTTKEGDVLLAAQRELATRIEAFNDKREELEKRRADLVKGGQTDEQVDRFIEEETRTLFNALQEQQKVVASAKDAVVGKLASLREDFATVLRLEPGDVPLDLTAQQQALLAQLGAMGEEQRVALRSGLERQIEENRRALVKASEDGNRSLSDLIVKTRLAIYSDASEREREQVRVEAEKTRDEQLAEIARTEAFILAEQSEVMRRRSEIILKYQRELREARTDEEREAIQDRMNAEMEALAEELGVLQDFEDARAQLVERRVQIEARAAQRIREADERYLRESNLIYRTFLSARAALTDAFNTKQEEAEREKAEQEGAKLREEEETLRQSLVTRQISVKEFRDRNAEFLKREQELQTKLADLQIGIWERLRRAAETINRKIAEDAAKHAAESTERFVTLRTNREETVQRLVEQKVKEGTERTIAIEQAKLEVDKEISAARMQLFADTALHVGATWAQMAAEGGHTFRDFANVALDAAFSFLQSMVPIWSAQILGGSLATPQSIITGGAAGIAQWAGLTLILESAVALARAALRFAEGVVAFGDDRHAGAVVAISGPGSTTGDRIPAWISYLESVVTARATMAGGEGTLGNRAILEWINATGASIVEYPPLEGWFRNVLMPEMERELMERMNIAPLLRDGVLVVDARGRLVVPDHHAEIDTAKMRADIQQAQQLRVNVTLSDADNQRVLEELKAEMAAQRKAQEYANKRFDLYITEERKRGDAFVKAAGKPVIVKVPGGDERWR